MRFGVNDNPLTFSQRNSMNKCSLLILFFACCSGSIINADTSKLSSKDTITQGQKIQLKLAGGVAITGTSAGILILGRDRLPRPDALTSYFWGDDYTGRDRTLYSRVGISKRIFLVGLVVAMVGGPVYSIKQVHNWYMLNKQKKSEKDSLSTSLVTK